MSENPRPAPASSISMSQMFAPLIGHGVTPGDIERGIIGRDLMPAAALLSGLGPTRLDPLFDLKAMIRMTPDLEPRFVETVESYVAGSEEGLIRVMLAQSHNYAPEIRDRIRWHAAHAGERRAVEALFADVHLTGTAIQRAYVTGLLLRVDTYGHRTRWSTDCDLEILRAGFHELASKGAGGHGETADLFLELTRPDAHEWPYREIGRVRRLHPLRIPLSPREHAEIEHDRMTQLGHWDLRRTGEHDHLSDDWRKEGQPPWAFAPDGRQKPETVAEGEGADEAGAAAVASIERLRAAAAAGEAKRQKRMERRPAPEPDHKEMKEPGHSRPAAYILDPPRDREAGRLVEGISGRSLPLVLVPKQIAHARSELVARYPYAVEIVDRILGSLQPGDVAKLRNILLVGTAGCGKTTLLSDVGAYLRLPTTTFPCASVADGSFGGTPMQWSTRRPSTPLQAIVRSVTANPLIILDELEKTGSSPHAGSLVHALLPLLEGHTASVYFETALETNADLSRVSFVATANSLDGIPAPLLDRFLVLRMPEPGVEHAEVLANAAVRQMREAAMNPFEWLPDFAPDELDVIRKTWGGGSLRRLNRAIDATLGAREAHLRLLPN